MKILNTYFFLLVLLLFFACQPDKQEEVLPVTVTKEENNRTGRTINLDDIGSFVTLSSGASLIEGDYDNATNRANAASNTAIINELVSTVFNSGNYSLEALTLKLPTGIYHFNHLDITPNVLVNGLQFIGEGKQNTIIKIHQASTGVINGAFHVSNLHNFVIKDFTIENEISDNNGSREGGIYLLDRRGTGNTDFGLQDGLLENIEIINAREVSCVLIGDKTSNITVRNCVIRGQREWNVSTSKAMFLAGEEASFITFENCRTYSTYDGFSSPADHYDSDNATNISYINCVADGTGSTGGVGFWNECNEADGQTSSYYLNCTTIQTWGGLGVTENSTVNAVNMHFLNSCDNSIKGGWTVWTNKINGTISPHLTLNGAILEYDQNQRPINIIADSTSFKYGGIHLETGATISNCRFINMPTGTYNISFFSANLDGSDLEDRIANINNCEFDKGIHYAGNPIPNMGTTVGSLKIHNNIFKNSSKIWLNKETAESITDIDIANNIFRGGSIAMDAHITWIKIKDNSFIGKNVSNTAAISRNYDYAYNIKGVIEGNYITGYTFGVWANKKPNFQKTFINNYTGDFWIFDNIYETIDDDKKIW